MRKPATDYQSFLAGKAISDPPTGLATVPELNTLLFPFQHDIVAWAIKRGRAAIWADCGLGKTPMQLEWARHVPGRVLILAPLAVAQQTVREGKKFGIDVNYARKQLDAGRITVTNYEMLQHFDPDEFHGVVLDESSILKAYDGKTRTEIIRAFERTPFRLACTATPSPNDMMELGNHAEFLGVMSRTEMLATFFCHDGGDTSQWRLKGHAERDFWRWLCSWAVAVRKPSDLGYEDEGFALPELVMHDVCVRVDEPTSGMLFPMEASQLQDRLRARRDTIADRVAHAERVIRGSWIENKSANTTSNIESQTGIASRRDAESVMPQIHSQSARGLGNGPSHTEINEKKARNDTTQQMQKRSGNTSKNGESAIQTTRASPTSNADNVPSEADQSETGISARNSESRSKNMNAFLPAKAVDALSVALKEQSCRSITITRPESSEASCVPVATLESVNSRTALIDSGERQNTSRRQWIVWCALNDEQNSIASKLGQDCVSIYGSLKPEEKISRFNLFCSGEVPVLVTKPSIFGYGVNMQFSNHAVFLGLSDSFEDFYQTVRRQWRFGQKDTVHIVVITAETEGAVVANIRRKEAQALTLSGSMCEHMREIMKAQLHGAARTQEPYKPTVKMELPAWMK